MEFYIVGAVFLLLGVALVYWIVQNQRKQRQIENKDQQIEKLTKEVERLRNRHLTAKGGLSREDKLKVLDLIGKVDLLDADTGIVKLRVEDLRRELIKLMKKEKYV